MALIDRDYMRQTPRTHVGETRRPDLSWVDGPTPPRARYTVFWVTLFVLLALVAVGTALLLGAIHLS